MSAKVDQRERVEQVRMALAEDGWPDAIVYPCTEFPDDVIVRLLPSAGGVSPESCWRAFALTGVIKVCWACWSVGGDYETCDHDPLTSPWPPRSPSFDEQPVVPLPPTGCSSEVQV